MDRNLTLAKLKDNVLLKSTDINGDYPELLRVIWVREDSEYAFILNVTGRCPASSRMPERVERKDIIFRVENGTLIPIENFLITKDMETLDDELTTEQISTREKNYSLIKELVESDERLLGVLHSTTRGTAIRAAAVKLGTPVPRLYRLLTLYWWFGKGRNSLTPRNSLMGGRGIAKFAGKEKIGRPNAITVLEGESSFKGVNVTSKDKEKFLKSLHEYWIKEDVSKAETYRRMCERLYVKWNRNAENKIVKHKIDPRLIPSEAQFLYHAEILIHTNGLTRYKKGHMDWAQKFMSRSGSASDITLGPTDVYDMDVLVLKCIAVTNTKAPEVIGPVSACLCVDRASRAVVGFHEFVGPETWERYRLALFFAFTPTAVHLELLKLHEWAKKAQAFGAFGWCNGVFVDRGPARGKDAFMAVVDSLGLERAIAPTERADLKAVVESINGKFQLQVANLPGGYSRKQGRRQEMKAENARAEARVPVHKIREFLVSAIAEHNEFHNASDLLTEDMIYDKVPPTPVDIFRWGQKNVRGETSPPPSNKQLYAKLLPQTVVSVSSSGVRHKRADFNSNELIKHRERNLGKRKLSIVIYYDGLDPQRRYWEMPNGELGILEMKAQQKNKYGGMTATDYEDYQVRETASKIKKNHEKRKKGYVTQTQEKILESVTGVKRKKTETPILSPSQNMKIANMHGREEMKKMSRNLLTEDIPSELGARAEDLSTAAPPKVDEEVQVSPARANFLKFFRKQP